MAEDLPKSSSLVSETSSKEVASFPVVGDLTQQITTIKFDGSNYLTWLKSVLTYIEGKDKKII